MKCRRYGLITIGLITLLTSVGFAKVWDATKDFGPSNPNGAWSYGYGVTGTSFTPNPIYDPNCAPVPGVVCWTAQLSEQLPVVAFNTTGGFLSWETLISPPDALSVHPAWDYGQDTIVAWTAPKDGGYTINGFFELLDISPTGIIGLVYRNGTQLYSQVLLGPPAHQPDQVGGREDFYFQLQLNAGDVISFGVNNDGWTSNDTTGFNATVTPTPEPISLMLFGTGFIGLAGAVRRRLKR